MKRARAKWGADFDPYRHFDLDYVVVNPNMDPLIRPFEILKQEGEDIVLKTGFGATIRRSADFPMPHFDSFSVSEPEQMADFAFDDPAAPVAEVAVAQVRAQEDRDAVDPAHRARACERLRW